MQYVAHEHMKNMLLCACRCCQKFSHTNAQFGVNLIVYSNPNCGFDFIFSANNGNVDVIECLLNAGAKIDARTEWGDLPIHYAACWGTHQVLEYLFEEGSPVDKPAAGK